MSLNFRHSTVQKTLGSYLAPGASYTITAYEPGGQVEALPGGGVITLREGHGFAVDDKFLVNPGTDNTFAGPVTAVTATSITVDSVPSSVQVGSILFNLGQDNGTVTPSFQNSGLTIYSDMDGSNHYGYAQVTSNSEGEYFYWHKGIDIWELIRSGSTVLDYIAGVGAVKGPYPNIRYAHLYATGGVGTSGDPWTGWENSVQNASATDEVKFVPGYYSTSGVTYTASSGSQCPSIIGSGINRTFITTTADAPALKITATGGTPNKILGFMLSDITFRAGIAVTNYLVELDYLDFYWDVSNIGILTNSYLVGTGLYLLDCQNGNISNLWIRGDNGTTYFTNGVLAHCDDSNQRGNIQFLGGTISNVTIGVKSTSTSNSNNNYNFFGTKIVNSSGLTIGVDGFNLNNQADEWGFFGCHVERFAKAWNIVGADGFSILNYHIDCGSGPSNPTGIYVKDSNSGFIGSGVLANLSGTGSGILFDGTAQQIFVGPYRTYGTVTNEVTYAGTYAGNRRNIVYLANEAIISKIGLTFGNTTNVDTTLTFDTTDDGTIVYKGATSVFNINKPVIVPDAAGTSTYVEVQHANGNGAAVVLRNTDSVNNENSPSIFFEPGGASKASNNAVIRCSDTGKIQFVNDTGTVTTQIDQSGGLYITDGITAPGTASGYAIIYVDTDGDLKIKFGDGTTKTIVTDAP